MSSPAETSSRLVDGGGTGDGDGGRGTGYREVVDTQGSF